VAFPVYLTLVASTQTAEQIVQNVPMSLLPGRRTCWRPTARAVRRRNRPAARTAGGPMMWVSLVMALVIAIGKIAISLLSAFAIVYFRFPLRNLVFWMIFVTLMLPVEVRIGPTYKVVPDLGMLNTYAGLTIPLIASATATFLFRQFFLTVPDELVEAARIDGAGPDALLQGRAAAAVAHLDRGPVRDPVHLRLEPVPVAAAGHHQRRHVPGGDGHQAHGRRRRLHRVERVMATAILAMLPPALVVILMQKWFVKGLVDTEK
jgi:sn-glycerol 3-phosphate transport system permease protein